MVGVQGTLSPRAPTTSGRLLRGALSRASQRQDAVLRNALSNAVREELITRNVTKMVRTRTPEYDVGGGLDPLSGTGGVRALTSGSGEV